MYIFVSIIALAVFEANSYVLLQVKKDKNKSNIDALIHKVVPALKENGADTKMDTRQSRYRNADSEHELENFVLSIDTGSKYHEDSGSKVSNMLKHAERAIVDHMRNNPAPIYRSSDGNVIQPQLVNFRSGNGKPSVLLDVNTNSIVQVVKDALSSKTVQRTLNMLTKKAATVFRAFMEEMRRNSRQKSAHSTVLF